MKISCHCFRIFVKFLVIWWMAWMPKFFKLRFSYVNKPNLFSLQSFYGKWNVFSVYFNFLSNTPIFFVAKKQHFSKQQAFFQVFCHNSIFTGALEPIIIKIYLWGLQLLKENNFCKPGSNFEMSLCCKLKKKEKLPGNYVFIDFSEESV